MRKHYLEQESEMNHQKNDEAKTEPFDKIFQTLINSVSISDEQDHINKEISSPSLMETENNKSLIFHKTEFPNFWLNKASEDKNGEKIGISTRGQSSESSGSTTRRRFISKSANKSGNPLRNKQLLPKTAKSGKVSEDMQDTNWMKVLEERSKGQISVDPGAGGDSSFHEDDDKSSFMTEFHGRNIFTAGSSSEATSIGWADDAVESQSTDALARQWAQIEQVFYGEDGGYIPEGMSDTIYKEVILWRKAFSSKSSKRKESPAKMSNSLHINESFTTPASLQVPTQCETNCPQVDILSLDFPSPNMSLQTFCPDQSPSRSPSPLNQEFTLDLPQVESSGPSSFVQSWLENLTTNFNADEDHPYHDYEEPQSLPQNLDSFYNNQNPQRFIKSQRPISSKYLNRTWGDGDRIGSAAGMKVPQKIIDWDNLEDFDTKRSKNPSSTTNRKASAWSRHTNSNEEEEEEENKKKISGRGIERGKQARKNFISWLLFDENEENLNMNS